MTSLYKKLLTGTALVAFVCSGVTPAEAARTSVKGELERDNANRRKKPTSTEYARPTTEYARPTTEYTSTTTQTSPQGKDAGGEERVDKRADKRSRH